MTPTETPGAIANCERCGRKLRVAAQRREASAPFKLSKNIKGFCPECVMTQFLYNTYPINMQIDEAGPQVLLNPLIRDAFLMSGILDGCDMSIEEINWHYLVENWSLPVKIQKTGLNPYRMGESRQVGRGANCSSHTGSPLSGSLLVTKDPKTGELLDNGQPLRETSPELAESIGNLIELLKDGTIQ